MFLYTVILFDSVYQKDRNYYPKVFLERFIHSFFEDISEFLGFRAFEVPAKTKKGFSSWKINNFIGVSFEKI